jgi:hypothetical protein
MKVNVYHASEVPSDIVEQIGFTYDYYNILVITDSAGEIIFWNSDNMEPEDATFHRDLSWIPEIIEKAYELGRKQGYDEQLLEAYNASRDDIPDELNTFSDFKLGPAK